MDVSKTGSYAVAYQIGSVIDLVSNSINLAWVPWLFSNLKNFEKNKNKIRKTTILGILGIVSIAVIFILLLPFIVKLFVSKEFEISFPVIILVVIGLVFQGCYLLFVNYLFYNGRTKIVSIITFSIAGINIIMNYFMITTYGILGGAIATALCFFLKFLIIFLVSNKLYKIF
jgi:O-antigen/teichoic acid export membrane protein